MDYIKLGTSDLEVSRLGFGCMSLEGNHKENLELVAKAIDSGINFFDTADLYQFGENEISLGRAIKDKRDQIILSTKVGNQWSADKSGWSWNPSREYILEAVDKSLKRLQTDYIDLYLLHGGTTDDPMDETIDAFERLRQSGKILNYGISSIRPNVIREYVKRSSIICVMMQYSILDRRPEEVCFGLLAEKGIGVLARGVVAKGLLINKEVTGYLNYSEKQVEKLISEIRNTTIPPQKIALEFVLNHRAVSCAVIGFRNKDQLNQVIKAFHSESSPDIVEMIGQILPINFYSQHR